jgi:hypothetical protein
VNIESKYSNKSPLSPILKSLFQSRSWGMDGKARAKSMNRA